MTTTGELVTRVQAWLMDQPATGVAQTFTRDQIRAQLTHVGSQLAALNMSGVAFAVQAVASKAYYLLDEQAIVVTSGTATGGSATTLVDSGADFVTLGVVVGDRIRNLTDGSQALVTGVAATTLTVLAFTGGVDNVPAASDAYLVETPLQAQRLLGISQVYHNGQRLLRTTEAELDAKNVGWETLAAGTPRYWLQDSLIRPTEIRLVPAPNTTGSGVIQFPPVPFPLLVANNLIVFATHDTPDLTADDTPHGFCHAYEDWWVMETAATMASWQTDREHVALTTILPSLVQLWRDALRERV